MREYGKPIKIESNMSLPRSVPVMGVSVAASAWQTGLELSELLQRARKPTPVLTRFAGVA